MINVSIHRFVRSCYPSIPRVSSQLKPVYSLPCIVFVRAHSCTHPYSPAYTACGHDGVPDSLYQHSDEFADAKNELKIGQSNEGLKYGMWVNLACKVR